MHALQPKQKKLKSDEVKQILDGYNISVSQLPKIKMGDPGLPPDCQSGDVVEIERKFRDKVRTYYRVVV